MFELCKVSEITDDVPLECDALRVSCLLSCGKRGTITPLPENVRIKARP